MSGSLVKVYNSTIASCGRSVGAFAKWRLNKKRLHFPFISQAISTIPFGFGWKFRRAVYSKLLAGIGEDAVIHHGVIIEDERTTIGKDVWISVGSYIDYVIIEDHVLIGQKAILLAGRGHHNMDRLDVPIKLQGNPPKEPVTIGRGAWKGAGAIVMADVGNDAIVGAGSVVTRPVPSFAIVAGNPAKVIRMRNEEAGSERS